VSRLSIQSTSVEATMQVGEAIGSCATPGDIIALQGELGAGKTQLVRGIAQGLGLDPRQVSSPTFVMVQEYEPPPPEEEENGQEKGDRPFIPVLVHIDAYRIRSPDELESIGWAGHGEELRDGAVIAIEWAKLIRPALGDDLLWIEIEHAPEGRQFLCSAIGAWQAKMQLLSQSIRAAGLALNEGAEP